MRCRLNYRRRPRQPRRRRRGARRCCRHDRCAGRATGAVQAVRLRVEVRVDAIVRSREVREVELVRDRARATGECERHDTGIREELAGVVRRFRHQRQRQSTGRNRACEGHRAAAIAVCSDVRHGEAVGRGGLVPAFGAHHGRRERPHKRHADDSGQDGSYRLHTESISHNSKRSFVLRSRQISAAPPHSCINKVLESAPPNDVR